MSGTRAPAVMETREGSVPGGEWSDSPTGYVLTAEIEVGEAGVPGSPIRIEGDKLEIESALLEIGRVYPFEYLGAEMVLWKLPTGAIDLFEIVEE